MSISQQPHNTVMCHRYIKLFIHLLHSICVNIIVHSASYLWLFNARLEYIDSLHMAISTNWQNIFKNTQCGVYAQSLVSVTIMFTYVEYKIRFNMTKIIYSFNDIHYHQLSYNIKIATQVITDTWVLSNYHRIMRAYFVIYRSR